MKHTIWNKDGDLVMVARRVFKTGLQQLWYRPESDEWFVTLDNRTNHTKTPIPADRVEAWRQALCTEDMR